MDDFFFVNCTLKLYKHIIMKKITLLAAFFLMTFNQMNAQFTEGFETGIPATWTVINGGDANTWVQFTTAPFVITGTASALISYSATAHDDYLITPAITVVAGVNDRFSFKARSYDAAYPEQFALVISTTTPTAGAFTIPVAIIAPDSSLTVATDYSFSLSAYVGQTIYIGMYSTTTDMWRIAVDDVVNDTPPACSAPTLLNSSSITTNSATISWTASVSVPTGGYQYYVATTNTAPTAGTTPTGTVAAGVTTANLTGLPSATQHFYWVRSDCGSGTSAWTASANFTTLCDATNVPFTQNFESVTVPAIPMCSSVVNVGTGNVWTTAAAPGSGFTTKALRYVYSTPSAANTWFFTQGVNLTAGTSYRISYNYGNNSTFYTESLKVAYGTSANNTAMTNVLADHPTINTNAIQLNQVDFTPTTTGVYYFGFQAYSIADQFYLFVDNISVDVTPLCSAPINLAASMVTSNSANLAWSAVASATDYEYVLDTTAADPVVAGTNQAAITYPATGLMPLTQYYFHVRTNCTGTPSAWSTVTFTTLATPPANDECSTAVALTPGGVFGEQLTDGTNVGATLSSQTAPTTCFGFSGGDVWYSVVVPASGNITIETGNSSIGGTGIDTVITAYSGTCGALIQIGCDDDSGAGAYSLLVLTAQTPGSTLYFRVYEYGNNNFGGFGVSAYDGSLGINNFNNSNFSYFPNPVKDVLNLQYSEEISKVQVINLLGQEVMVKSINASQSQIDMSSLTAGTYLVKVTANGYVKTIKMIKE